MSLLRQCSEPGCSILTIGDRCIDHDRPDATPEVDPKRARSVSAAVLEHRYRLAASLASGLTAFVAIRVLRHAALGH